jgi:hypothetical protein
MVAADTDQRFAGKSLSHDSVLSVPKSIDLSRREAVKLFSEADDEPLGIDGVPNS